MTDHVLSALVQRRATLAGELHKAQGTLHQMHADLAALDAVIRQLDPDYPIEAIRPRYRRQATPAEQGSISRAILDHLRRAQGPLGVKDLADRLMVERGLNAADRGLVRSMRKRVDMALRYQRTNGMVEAREVEGGEVVWAVAG